MVNQCGGFCKIAMALRLLILGLLLAVSSAKYKDTVHNLFTSLKHNVDPMPAVVNGSIPPWLELTRRFNGFGQFEGGHGNKEWRWAFLFDVTAYAAKWEVKKGGSVTVAAAITNSSYYEEGLDHIPLFRTFGGTVPPMNPIQKAKTLLNSLLSDNFNVNIVPIGE